MRSVQYGMGRGLISQLSLRGSSIFWHQNKVSLSPLHRWNSSSNKPSQQQQAQEPSKESKQRSSLFYLISVGLFGGTVAMLSIPLYKAFCTATGLGGAPQINEKVIQSNRGRMRKVHGAKPVTVNLIANTAPDLGWEFKPMQSEGETALAFFEAYNGTDKELSGIATYNILPFSAGQYFNKIQCFCFEEQVLKPGERVDMPVFFYLDPDYAVDPATSNVTSIDLSYYFADTSTAQDIIAQQQGHGSLASIKTL